MDERHGRGGGGGGCLTWMRDTAVRYIDPLVNVFCMTWGNQWDKQIMPIKGWSSCKPRKVGTCSQA